MQTSFSGIAKQVSTCCFNEKRGKAIAVIYKYHSGYLHENYIKILEFQLITLMIENEPSFYQIISK